jgi:hypothetical protein
MTPEEKLCYTVVVKALADQAPENVVVDYGGHSRKEHNRLSIALKARQFVRELRAENPGSRLLKIKPAEAKKLFRTVRLQEITQ